MPEFQVFITILFVGAVDHSFSISGCEADEVYSILLAEQILDDRSEKRGDNM